MVTEDWYSMNLQNYYEYINQIVKERGHFSVEDEYYEVHHIIPRAFGGEPLQISHRSRADNLIWLTYKEHYTAHKILALDNMTNYKAVFAYMFMSSRCKGEIVDSAEEYDALRRAFTERNREHSTGKPSPMKGKHYSEDIRKMVSERTKAAMQRPEVKQKISLNSRGRPSWNKGLQGCYSDETLKKMSEAKAGKKLSEEHRVAISKGGMGRKQSEETIRKIKEAQSGKNCKRNKAVVCIDTGVEYYSAKYASEELGVSHSNIIQVCKGKKKSANGLRFRYKDEN